MELFGYAERNLITSSAMFAAGIRFWETITKKLKNTTVSFKEMEFCVGLAEWRI